MAYILTFFGVLFYNFQQASLNSLPEKIVSCFKYFMFATFSYLYMERMVHGIFVTVFAKKIQKDRTDTHP